MRKGLILMVCFTAATMLSCGDSSSSSDNEITKDTMPSATNFEGQPVTDTSSLKDSGGVVK